MFPSSAKNDSNKNESGGSLRRVVPLLEDDRGNVFGRQNEDLNKMFKIYRQEYIIMAEYKMIETEDLQGVYVIPSRASPLCWFGVLFVRNGPYKDGVFRFTMNLDENYPDSTHPAVVFDMKILHPVINPETNELNLLGGFPSWHKNEQHLWQVLKYIQWAFSSVEASVCHGVDNEACKLVTDNKKEFMAKAQEIVEQSKQILFQPPPTDDKHYITFQQFNPDVHKRDKLVAYVQEKNESPGSVYSWVLPRSDKPLGRPPSPVKNDSET